MGEGVQPDVQPGANRFATPAEIEAAAVEGPPPSPTTAAESTSSEGLSRPATPESSVVVISSYEGDSDSLPSFHSMVCQYSY